MRLLDKVKLYALEIVNLIDNGDLESFETYGKIGDLIDKLDYHRLDVVKYLIKGEKNGNSNM
jgi:hypothetical protein